jgi:hypothetical protein
VDSRTLFKWTGISLILGLSAFAYWHFDPQKESFFPVCPFLKLTGYRCIGCGSQRALHDLLHLDVGAAFGENILAVLFIPYLITGFIFDLIKNKSEKLLKWRKALYGNRAIIIVLVIMTSFWILRNLPPFEKWL